MKKRLLFLALGMLLSGESIYGAAAPAGGKENLRQPSIPELFAKSKVMPKKKPVRPLREKRQVRITSFILPLITKGNAFMPSGGGDAPALYRQAVDAYYGHNGQSVDFAKAIRLFKRGMKEGCPRSYYCFARMVFHKLGVAFDYKLYVRLLHDALVAGHVIAGIELVSYLLECREEHEASVIVPILKEKAEIHGNNRLITRVENLDRVVREKIAELEKAWFADRYRLDHVVLHRRAPVRVAPLAVPSAFGAAGADKRSGDSDENSSRAKRGRSGQ